MTVLKDATVGVFKDALAGLIGQPLSHDLVQLAEVKDNCIVRILVRVLYPTRRVFNTLSLYILPVSPPRLTVWP